MNRAAVVICFVSTLLAFLNGAECSRSERRLIHTPDISDEQTFTSNASEYRHPLQQRRRHWRSLTLRQDERHTTTTQLTPIVASTQRRVLPSIPTLSPATLAAFDRVSHSNFALSVMEPEQIERFLQLNVRHNETLFSFSDVENFTQNPTGVREGESPLHQLPVEYLSYSDLTQLANVRISFIVLYSVVMFTAVCGNVLVCHTVLTNRRMQTVVNYYILNLAICDLLIGAFVLPSKAFELLASPDWFPVTELLCSTFLFLQTVVVFASLLTLVATCFERYFAIVHPLKSRMQQSKKRTCRILVLVWAVSTLASLPNFLHSPSLSVMQMSSEQYGTIRRSPCINNFDATFRQVYFTALFVGFYLLPLGLIAFTSICITKSLLSSSVLRREGSLLRQEINRRKVGKMILIVVVSFTLSWTPYFLVTIVTQYQNENFMQKHDFFFTMLSINLFAFLHSSVNPLIYATMSTRFRQGFIATLHALFHCRRSQTCSHCSRRTPTVNGAKPTVHSNPTSLLEHPSCSRYSIPSSDAFKFREVPSKCAQLSTLKELTQQNATKEYVPLKIRSMGATTRKTSNGNENRNFASKDDSNDKHCEIDAF